MFREKCSVCLQLCTMCSSVHKGSIKQSGNIFKLKYHWSLYVKIFQPMMTRQLFTKTNQTYVMLNKELMLASFSSA